MKITVFGGASPIVGDPEYDFAYSLGYKLGSLGYTVVTGGYHGTMQAISQGAKEAGTHVIGITCLEIEKIRPVKVNEFVGEEYKSETLALRIYQMIDLCDAAIALPGGIGTLAEITLMWNRLILGSTKRKPFILLGNEWKNLLDVFSIQSQKYVSRNDFVFITTVDTIEETLDILKRHLKD